MSTEIKTGSHSRLAFSGWVTVFVCAMILYVCTLAPDVVWQDQGDYQFQAALCNLNRPGDVVRVHPLFIVTAHLVGRLGIFSYACSANLVSAVFTAATVANVFLLVWSLTGSVFGGVLSACVFGLAHSVWFLGVQAQTYSMANAAMSGGLVLVVNYIVYGNNRRLLVMGLLFGLGISAHLMSQVAFFVIMVWLAARCFSGKLSFVTFAGIIVSWFIGAALLWVVIGIEYKRSGNFSATLLSALWGKWGDAVFNVSRIGILLKRSVMYFILNFPTPLILLAVPGILLGFKKLLVKSIAKLLSMMTILYFLFAVRYDVPNQNNFFLPMYLLVSVYVGMGYVWLFDTRSRRWSALFCVLVLAIPFTYYFISEYARSKDVDLGTRRHIPYRDAYSYYLRPWQQGQIGPRRFAEELFERLPTDAIVIADTTTLPPLQYVHFIEGKREDITVLGFDESDTRLMSRIQGGDRVFTISNVRKYYPGWVRDSGWLKPFKISDVEHVYEVVVPPDVKEL